MTVTILPSTPPSPLRRPPGARTFMVIGAGVTVAAAAVDVFASGWIGGSDSAAQPRVAVGPTSALASLPAPTILARARAAAIRAGAAHVALIAKAKGTTVRFSDYDSRTSGTQLITTGRARAAVRVVGNTTFFRGNKAGITHYFGLPVTATLPPGTWYRLTKHDRPYHDVTAGVTVASMLRQLKIASPYQVMPATTRDGVLVVGVRGRVAGGGMPQGSTATLWISARGAPLPVEYDARSTSFGSMVVHLSDWGHAHPVSRPARTRAFPAGLQSNTSSQAVADARMSSNLRNLATIEETYLTDNMTYADARALMSYGLQGLSFAPGESIIIHLNGSQGYCLAGRLSPQRYFVYPSLEGGLRGPQTTDTCSAAMYPTDGGYIAGAAQSTT